MIGILLLNVGTPESPSVDDVKKYLQEFLTDKEVIRGPWFVREILFKHYIVPRRAPFSAKKYETIWTSEGSPLMVYSQKIKLKLQEKLGSKFLVELGMRYGKPSIESGLKNLIQNKVSEIVLVPLFPQYAAATTKTSVNKAIQTLQKLAPQVPHRVTGDFFGEASYLELLANKVKQTRRGDYLLFSFHGLPVSHLKGKHQGCYQQADCCERFQERGARCYRAQCLFTAKSVANKLGLSTDQWGVSFQSRLGPVKWIEPYTDETLKNLPQQKQGVNLDICAPAFVVEGLETLEEICHEGAENFKQQGGKSFNYIPCLNDDSEWISWLSQFVSR